MQRPYEGRGLARPGSPRIAPALARLLANRRYEDALTLLRAAQRERPGSAAIAEGIALLEPTIIVEPMPEPRAPPARARAPRPIDCERTAQIALVPEAGALLARARGAHARRARRTRWRRLAMWAGLAVVVSAILGAAVVTAVLRGIP